MGKSLKRFFERFLERDNSPETLLLKINRDIAKRYGKPEYITELSRWHTPAVIKRKGIPLP